MSALAAIAGRPSEGSVYCPQRWRRRSNDRRWGAVTSIQVNYADQTDEALVALLGSRDVHALESLYARHARAVYSLALKMLGDPTAAEEIVQECFLKLWRQPELYLPERGKLLSWLLGVTHHRAVDQLRRRKLEQRFVSDGDLEPQAGGDGDPELQAWGRFQSEAVGRALASLPPSQRLALELAYLRGMTQAEIAASLGEPLGTIKTRTRLAIQKLRALPELAALVSEP